MCNIKISYRDVQFLKGHLALKGKLSSKLDAATERGVLLTGSEADELRDLCGDRLMFCGFDEDYVANAHGKRLEEMIDKLFVG